MGGSTWSDDFYKARAKTRDDTGTTAFDYSDRVTTSSARHTWAAHKTLDPKGIIREARDSDDHPNSNAIAVLFDVTGSMGNIPVTLQKKLPSLLTMLVRKGYIEDPQILFGAVGDATCDRVPLQVGQYESGNEMEDSLGNILIEQGGGGGRRESYELGMYFFANKIKMDCLDKRGDKGYLFTIGDEMPYKTVKKSEILEVLGDTVQADIPIEEVIEALQAKYHYFHIIPDRASHGGAKDIFDEWVRLLEQNVLHLDNPDGVCETIAMAIGLNEDVIDIDTGLDDLTDFDVSDSLKISISKAVATIDGSNNGALVKSVTNIPEVDNTGSSTRL